MMDYFTRIIDGVELYVYPDTGYKAQTALQDSIGTLSLEVNSIYIGSFSKNLLFKLLEEASLLELSLYNEPHVIIKGLASTICQNEIRQFSIFQLNKNKIKRMIGMKTIISLPNRLSYNSDVLRRIHDSENDVILDAKNLIFADSAALGIIVATSVRLKKSNKVFKIINVNKNSKDYFEDLHIIDIEYDD